MERSYGAGSVSFPFLSFYVIKSTVERKRTLRFADCCFFVWVKVTKLCDVGHEDCVTAVKFMQRGTHLAVACNSGKVWIEALLC